MQNTHLSQVNEFIGAYGKYSIIHPIGYGKILKKMKHGAPVRSAVEQFEIHRIANTFDSSIIHTPKVFELCGIDSYTMEHVLPGGVFIQTKHYKHFPCLMRELNRFFSHMVTNGYFPYKFTLLYFPDKNVFMLFDFSLFGTFSNGFVKFKQIKYPVQLVVAEYNYGVFSFIHSEEKIEPIVAEF